MKANATNALACAEQLVGVLTECADEVDLRALGSTLAQRLCEHVGIQCAGLEVFDEERSTVRVLHVTQTEKQANRRFEPAAVHDEEVAHYETEIPHFLQNPDCPAIRDLSGICAERGRRLAEDGVSDYISVPIWLRDRLLGAVFVGSRQVDGLNGTVSLVHHLGRLVPSVLYNCINHARFARGDRRRDALVELSGVINSSLDLDTVIKHARRLIASLEGHCASTIMLLGETGATFKCYEAFHQRETKKLQTPTPTVHRVASDVMAWLLEHGVHYESSDLESQVRFDMDEDYRKRGVRRYIAVPLIARGRILGGFVFGSTDHRPRRKVEYWLYENIALQLALALDNAQKHEQLRGLTNQLANQNEYLREEIQLSQGFGEMVGSTPAMTALRKEIARVAPTDATVLITGETGVGKELVARSIHQASSRDKYPLIKVNCPSIPESMFESELFGHERGAFTSAVEKRIGRFELAAEGTLFLDEIGELSMQAQAKLLRVLQDGEFERVGGSKTIRSNARVIAATNRDLSKEVDEGRFRADLFFRLNVVPIHVPPLRERKDDIPNLVARFAEEFGARCGKRIERVDDSDMARLQRHDWDGNIRELRHLMERAVIFCDGPVLALDLPEPSSPLAGPEASKLDAVQAETIRSTLDDCNWVIEGPNGAAASLGLKPSTLRFRMKRLGITRESA